MSKFTYSGEDQEGNKVTKTIDADDRYAVYDIARRDGHKVTSCLLYTSDAADE